MDEWITVLLRIIVPIAAALLSFGVTCLVNFIKSKTKNQKVIAVLDKFAAAVEDIAETVENVFAGETSATKLTAFREICEKKGIDVENAVEYLEKHIIPTSKKINSVPAVPERSEDVDLTD